MSGSMREVFLSGDDKPKNSRTKKPRNARHRDEGQEVINGTALRVRNMRKQLGLTLEELAVRSKVSRAMISKVERSEKSPTLSVLVRIAKGLNMTLSSLLGAEPDKSEISMIRAESRTTFRDPESGFERELLSLAQSGNGLEIVLHRIPASSSSGLLPAYAVPTEKYIILQEGKLVVHVNGHDYVMNMGDTMHFEVKTPYSFSNPGQTTCVYYVVLVRRQML
jgi:transcriptional regulator with XRE-family HTH domain